MKIVRNVLGFAAGLVVAAAVVLAPATVSAAGTGVFSVSPASGTHTIGSTFSVTISEDSGANNVDSARAELTYNPALLEVVNFSTAGNPFTTCVSPAGAAGGKITTGDCTLLGGKKQGKQTLATVTFKVIGAGSATLPFASSSQLIENGSDLSWSQVSGSYTLTAGKGADPVTPTNPGTSTPAPSTSQPAPTTKSTGPSTSVATTNSGTVAGEETQAAETTVADDKKDNSKQADDKKNDDSKETGNTSGAGWLWLLALLAVVGGFVAARRLSSAKAAQTAETPAAPAAAPAPTKEAADKPAKKSGKKTGRK